MTKFKKTRLMNLIGGFGLTILCGALFFNKIGAQSIWVLATIIILYAAMVSTALCTAQAIKDETSSALRKYSLWLNYTFVGVYSFGIIIIILATFASPDAMKRMLAAYIPGAFAFVVPELINIYALRAIKSSENNQA